jgi:hypothetical protein
MKAQRDFKTGIKSDKEFFAEQKSWPDGLTTAGCRRSRLSASISTTCQHLSIGPNPMIMGEFET